MAANAELDITSSEKLDRARSTTLGSEESDFALAGVRAPVVEHARRSGVLDAIGEDRVFRTIDEAVRALG